MTKLYRSLYNVNIFQNFSGTTNKQNKRKALQPNLSADPNINKKSE